MTAISQKEASNTSPVPDEKKAVRKPATRKRGLDKIYFILGARKMVIRTTLSILSVWTLFFVQEMSNSVVDVMKTLRGA